MGPTTGREEGRSRPRIITALMVMGLIASIIILTTVFAFVLAIFTVDVLMDTIESLGIVMVLIGSIAVVFTVIMIRVVRAGMNHI